MRYIFLIGLLAACSVAFAQKTVLSKIPATGKDIRSFIPEGFDTLATAAGDLNKDKIGDLVMVLGSVKENSAELSFEEIDSLPQRILVVLLKTASGYQLAAKTQTAILCKDCGGVFGDPFAGITVTSGVLTVEHYGGSAWRWGYTHKFRYQQNSFYLIGETTVSYWNVSMCDELGEFAATEFKDVNFLTGQYVEKKVSEEGCKYLVNKKGKMKVKPLKKLAAFTIEN